MAALLANVQPCFSVRGSPLAFSSRGACKAAGGLKFGVPKSPSLSLKRGLQGSRGVLYSEFPSPIPFLIQVTLMRRGSFWFATVYSPSTLGLHPQVPGLFTAALRPGYSVIHHLQTRSVAEPYRQSLLFAVHSPHPSRHERGR